MGSLHVTAGDGRLTVTGPVTRDPEAEETHWEQIEPGLFQQVGGTGRIAFRTGADGAVTALLTDADPTIAWYQAPGLHRITALAGLAVLALTLLGWTVGALVRLVRRRGRAGQPAVRLLGAALGTLLLAATACFALLTADPNALNQALFLADSPLLTVVPALVLTALALTAPLLVCAVLAWRRRWWGVPGRLHYTALTLASLLLLLLAGAYDLAGTSALDLLG
ncbi:hypothetical protein ACH4E7_02630 [Kitasatospora sp. NPDC018058]|uniref:hypothetical protein n=1 Tax=Kitasatospora sp. NPDC018058 TaxID=3364025 RepID=UPI0037C12B71